MVIFFYDHLLLYDQTESQVVTDPRKYRSIELIHGHKHSRYNGWYLDPLNLYVWWTAEKKSRRERDLIWGHQALKAEARGRRRPPTSST
jgi:hypothetical protein